MLRDREPPPSLSRANLYELVWSKPMISLAPELGLSDVGLAKMCRKHRIPTPGVGYWSKKESGKHVSRRRLPALKNPALEFVLIRPRQDRDGEVVDSVIRKAVEYERQEDSRIEVGEELSAPHQLVRLTEASIKNVSADEDGLVRPRSIKALELSVSPANIDRALRTLGSLLKAMEDRGYRIEVDSDRNPNASSLVLHGERVRFDIKEVLRREERVAPTQSSVSSYRWLENTHYDFIPTGRLSLRILEFGRDNLRRTWTDGKSQRIEGCLNAFLISALKVADAIKQRERQFREEREQRDRLQAERAERERLLTEEGERRRMLFDEVRRWNLSTQIRRYLEEVKETGPHEGVADSPCQKDERWLAWAARVADELDPLGVGSGAS